MKIKYQSQDLEKMRNIKEISNFLLREITVYENKMKMLEYENGFSPQKSDDDNDENKNNELNNEEEAQELSNEMKNELRKNTNT